MIFSDEANGSKYFLDGDTFLEDYRPWRWQQREYFICQETGDVMDPESLFLFKNQSVIRVPQMNDCRRSGEGLRFRYDVYYRKTVCLPEKWFPGICDAWVRLHAREAFEY